MRSSLRSLVVPGATLLALACGGGRTASKVPDDLSRDLELASSAGVQLAPEAAGQGIVSSIERVPQHQGASAKSYRSAPTARRHAPVPKPAVVEAPETKTADVSVEEQPTAPAAVATTAPAPEPMPTPSPEPGPDNSTIGSGDRGANSTGSDGRGGDGNRGGGIGTMGTILGGIMGVVIRGGGVGDDDHCERDPRGGGRHHPRGGAGGGVFGRPLPLSPSVQPTMLRVDGMAGARSMGSR